MILCYNNNRKLIQPVSAAAAESLQSWPTLCDLVDGSPPGSPVPGFSRQEHWSGVPFPSPMYTGPLLKTGMDFKGILRWLSGYKNPPAMQETQKMQVRSLGWEDPLEEGMTTHSSILAWRIPWTEEPWGHKEPDMAEVT